jgi:hypothetical protein
VLNTSLGPRATRNFKTASAMACPSYVLVPRPSSSISTNDSAVDYVRMCCVSSISQKKVDLPVKTSSVPPSLVNTLSTIDNCMLTAGTWHPICARMTDNAMERSRVDLPPILGPESSIGELRSTSFGINLVP